MRNFATRAAATMLAVTALMTGDVAHAQEGNRNITIVMPTEPPNLDPCNLNGGITGIVLRQNIVESLTELSHTDGTPLPRLALSWEQLDDTTWRFKLREGVTFHNGEPFNAASAAAAITRQAEPALSCTSRVKLPTAVLTPVAIDEHTLEIKAEPPQPLLPVFLSFVGMSPADTETELLREPIGTGPFVFDRWDANQRIELKRSETYWGAKPEAESVTYLWRAESALRAAMVDVGEADIAMELAPQDATDPSRDFTYIDGQTTRIRMIMQPPMDDIRVRRALNYAFDRQALIGTLFNENVVPAAQFIPPHINGFNPNLQPWPYDPGQAKSLLEEARADGVPVDQSIRLIGRTGLYPNGPEVLQAMAQMWKAVGFNVRVEIMEVANWRKLVNKPYDADRPAMLIQEMHDNNNGDAAFTLYFRYHGKGGQSETNLPELDALIDAADAASGDERRSLYQEANRMIAEDIVSGIFMYHMVGVMRVGAHLDYKPANINDAFFELAPIKFKG